MPLKQVHQEHAHAIAHFTPEVAQLFNLLQVLHIQLIPAIPEPLSLLLRPFQKVGVVCRPFSSRTRSITRFSAPDQINSRSGAAELLQLQARP